MTAQIRPIQKAFIREVTFTRLVKAPRELVFKVWTEQSHVQQWWGPRDFTNPVCEWDAKPGNKLHIDMHGPAGTPYDKPHPMNGTFHEVVAPERLVFTSTAFEDAKGEAQLEVLNTVTFTKHREGTKLTLHAAIVKATPDVTAAALEGMEEGWCQSLDRMENYIAGMNNSVFLLTRTFKAPREMLWKAWTEPKLMTEWWGPKGVTSKTHKMDFRTGGIYHYSMLAPNGTEMWGKFTYKEISPPERLVFINCFSDAKGGITRHPMVPNWPLKLETTITFAEHKNWTIVKIQWVPVGATAAERKVFEDMQESCRQGWGGSLDQLEDFLARQQG